MNKYIKFIAALALFTSIWGCVEDAEVTQYVTQERHDELISDPATVEGVSKAAISKTYAIFQESWSSHDDFGLKAFQFATDMMCEDMNINQFNWFGYDYELDNRGATYRRTNSTWAQFYEIIAKSNLHLETYFSEESTDPAILASKAEPLILRGIAYFHLVNFYQHTYKGHENDLGVPLTLKSIDDKMPRATVKEVYSQIIEDLTFGVDYANGTASRTDVDKYVAAAFLAKAYAHMEDWVNVEKYAKIAKDGGTDIVSAPGRDWSIASPDILWGYDVNTQNSTLWASFWSQMDQFLPRGYAAGGSKKLIHNLLYDKMPATDLRRQLWVNNTDYPEIAAQMKAGSKNDEVKMDDYDQLKFIAGMPELEQDYCFLRVQDPILLEIEALVEQGKMGVAKTLLHEFAVKRNPNFEAPSSQEELREEVRFQRRIELWAEGSNWFDMKRWKLTIDRTVEGSQHFTKFKVATDASRFYHEIPQRELEANPLLEQN